jgi:hypothetical protein
MIVEPIRVTPAWLELREDADAAARSTDLVAHLRQGLSAHRPVIVHDLACGSGAMARWLAPLLPGPQHWVLHDLDPVLLALAAANVPGTAANGGAVGVEPRLSDVTTLTHEDLAGASLVTASALLDLLTAEELRVLVRACAGAACPVLLALSVTGSVQLEPEDQLDKRLARAFDAHQRRVTSRGRLLGPDAVDATAEAFRRCGAEVLVAPSPWRLDARRTGLTAEWLTGWVDAACEREPGLAVAAERYRRRRLIESSTGRLHVTVGHADLLVLP